MSESNGQSELLPETLNNLVGFLDILVQIDLASRSKEQIENNTK